MTKTGIIKGQINTGEIIKGQINTSGTLYAKAEVGMRGFSTYELWLKEGNEGSIQDFLSSLAATDKFFIYKQSVSQEEWEIDHGLNKYPSVTVVDSADTIVYGEVSYLDKNTIKINFSGAFSGRVFLN